MLEVVYYDGRTGMLDMSKVRYILEESDGFSIDVGAGKQASFTSPSYSVAKAAFEAADR